MSDSKHTNQSRFKVWLLQAMYDVQAAETSYEYNHYEWTCYQSVQAVEKALKAVILHAGFRPPQTHKLGVLVGMSNRANKLFAAVKLPFRKIEAYTFIARYPFVIPGENKTPREFITKNDAITCLDIAKNIFGSIQQFLDQSQPSGEDRILESESKSYFYSAEEVDNRIKKLLEDLQKSTLLDVEKVYLYGSFSREKTRPRSTTMDILVIAKTELSFIERIEHVREITKGSYPIIEPFVYTPEEFTFMIEQEGEGYLENAIEEGKLLYGDEK